MLEQLKDMLTQVVDDPLVFRLVAKGIRRLYDALISQGFTSDEALKIVAAQGLGVKGS
jgi:hypothetical protein